MMQRIFVIVFCLLMAPLCVAAEPKPDVEWMNAEQISAALQEKSFVRKAVGAFHLYKQPQQLEVKLAGPLYKGWAGALRPDRHLFETSMRRLGKPMADYLIAEFKKDPDAHSIHEALGVMGEGVQSLAPTLYGDIVRQKRRNESVRLLGQIGKPSLPYARKLLSHRNHIVQSDGVDILAQLGPLAASEWRAVVKLEMADKESVPYDGLYALGAMGPGAKGALPWVMQCLKHRREMTRRAALQALAQISPNHRVAVAALQKYLADRRSDSRREAMILLYRGAFSPEIIRKTVGRGLRDREPRVRSSALHALLRIKQQPTAVYELALPQAEAVLKENNQGVTKMLLQVIAKSGPKGADWLADFLVKTIGTPDHYAAVEDVPGILRQMGSQAAHVIPKLETAISKARYPHQKQVLRDTIFILTHADWPKVQMP